MDIRDAKLNVDNVADELSGIVASIVKEQTQEIDKLIHQLQNGIDTFSNADLRDIMAKISVETYFLGVLKEQSSLKNSCAEALYKEGLAKSFSMTTGTQDARRNQSTLDNTDKQVVSILYNTVTNLLKTKCDEAHRVVSAINGVLMSRASDAKQYYNPRSEQDSMDLEVDQNLGE